MVDADHRHRLRGLCHRAAVQHKADEHHQEPSNAARNARNQRRVRARLLGVAAPLAGRVDHAAAL
eukprot:737630-Rhodomonas_salina.1